MERAAGRAKKFYEPGGELIARLALFYRIDPQRAVELPLWTLATLAEWMPRLQAEQRLMLAEAAMLPWLKTEQRGRTLRRWERMTRAGLARETTRDEAPERDAEKARAWFAAMGVKVAEAR